ncbi:hypothetical protein BU25DRAFT_449415 [Macroventuria anomochaeta]|uniref:Uncharacterized protein n=1 Tax=Macroventuria anomochaeta TaxID=301207 RepID=A0ACB6RXH6_9PLEO|nr:uncharacterized protein BU25DRAFT_449415 [Macroventuria anomochaeta]KAF2626479.1 hypothetical protein BU25DRAFT_449415 [Macroventuria anomochaeta]
MSYGLDTDSFAVVVAHATFAFEAKTKMCKTCEEELRGAALGLAALVEDDEQTRTDEKLGAKGALSRADSLLSRRTSPEQETQSKDTQEGHDPLVAIPTTPPSTKLMLTHSLNTTLTQSTVREEDEKQETDPPLFPLPNTSLDTRFSKEQTPTTKYAIDFLALPASGKTSKRNSGEIMRPAMCAPADTKTTKAGSEAGSKRNSREVMTGTESTLFSLLSPRVEFIDEVEVA